MAPKKKTTWLLVGDAAKAQLYAVSAIPLRLKKVASGALKSSRKTTHGPDHHSAARHIAHTGNGHGIHQRHEDVFIERVAEALDTAAGDQKYDDLIVVLPPKALAHFRKVVSPAVQKKIRHEIRSEWTHLTVPSIAKHLSARLP